MYRSSVLSILLLVTLPSRALLAAQDSLTSGVAATNAIAARAPKQQQTGGLSERVEEFEVRNVTLSDALLQLAERTVTTLAFSPTFTQGVRVSCACSGATVGEILDRLLADTSLTYRVVGTHVMVEPAAPAPADVARSGPGSPMDVLDLDVSLNFPGQLVPPPPTPQRQGTITGRVVDTQTMEPIATAQVFLPGANLGVLTGVNGGYQLLNVPPGPQAIRVQRMGYQAESSTYTVVTGQTVVADFELAREALALDEIVVTGTPGGVQRRAIGNVVGTIDAGVANLSPVTSVQDMIGNREPGVLVQTGGGTPGAGSVIRIRGASSLSLDNSPIIYVDGVRIEGGVRGGGGLVQASTSRLDDFSLEDIESIEIIKGPAAATLYGTEAANGVIQIITKRGASGGVAFDLTTRLGTHWFVNPREYFGNKWFRDPASGELISTYLYDAGPKARYGVNQQYHLGASGGLDFLRFNVGVDWDDEAGVYPNMEHERLGGRLNVDFYPTDRLSFRLSTSYVRRYQMNPEPTFGRGPVSIMLFGTHPLHAPQRRGFYVATPEDAADINAWMNSSRFTGSAVFTHHASDWLSQRLTLGIDEGFEENTVLYPRHPLGAQGPYGGLSAGERTDQALDLTNYTIDWGATATVPLSRSVESASSVGFQYYERQTSEATLVGRVFPAPQLTTIGAAASTTASSEFLENKTAGVYAQEQIGIRNAIFLTGALRVDNNSAFGSEFDLAVYPKVSGTWSLLRPFRFAPWIDMVRLRSAYGAAGQQPDAFAAVQIYSPEPGPEGSPAVTPAEIGNPTLKPERSEELEVGFDAGLFRDRAGLEFTFYNRTTRDAIVRRTVAPSTGFGGYQWVNVGQVSNWGTELALTASILPAGRVLAWDVDLGWSTMFSRLDRLGLDGTDRVSAGTGYAHIEGKPLGAATYYRIVSAEFVSGESGPVKNVMCDGGPGRAPIPFSAANCPQVYWGTMNPTWQIGASSTFTILRNLVVSARVDGQGGHVFSSQDFPPRIESTPWARVRWARDVPVLVAYEGLRQGVGYLEAGQVKLNELSLIYRLPARVAGSFGATQASIALQMHNVMQLWRAARHTIVAEQFLEGENLEAFYVPDPAIYRGSANHGTFVHGTFPTKSLMATIRLNF